MIIDVLIIGESLNFGRVPLFEKYKKGKEFIKRSTHARRKIIDY